MNVAIFGGSQPQPGESSYEDAQLLGRMLAEAGHAVLTGGYTGCMEAVSRGAAEAGGHVIGVTCEEIERWRPGSPNRWVAEERRFPSLHERLLGLMDGCDAAIALPGGPGTLVEISLMWNRMLINAIAARPLILAGEGWRRVFMTFYEAQSRYIPATQRKLLLFAHNVPSAVQQLTQSTGHHD
ncbi:MAG TPA: LOG family protein [Levilinea sp.]|nr:LOG family protein [Levilinea sp.]